MSQSELQSQDRIEAKTAGVMTTGVHIDKPVVTALDGDMRQVMRAYSDESLFTRAFIRGRRLLCPMTAVAREVPLSGRILDIGCGHGLLPGILASGSSARQIVAIDPSEAKMEVARRTVCAAFANIECRTAMAEQVIDGPFDAVTIVDVMYLLPDELKLQLMKHCRSLLKDDGVFIVKTNDTRPVWKYTVVRCEEFLMVKLIGFTFGGAIHFRSADQYLALLHDAGFDATVRKVDGGRPVPHRLFVCKPRARSR